jgi:hypothetical protein
VRFAWLGLVLCGVAQAQSWPGERVRSELRISNGVGWPRETAVKLRFDHAAEVDAGRSRADGTDVTVLRRSDDGGLTARHRVLDTGSAWNRADTELWFKLDDVNDAGTLSNVFALSLGGSSAGLEDAREVFLFADDFEDGTVDDWAIIRRSGTFTVEAADAGAHRGQYALLNQPSGSGGFQMNVPLDRVLPLDVVLDTWVFMDDPPEAQWAWFLRFDSTRDDSYNFGPDAAANNWRAGQRLGGTYSRYPGTIPFSASPARQWVRVVVGVQGQTLFPCVGSVCIDGGVVGMTLFGDAGIGFGRVMTSADSDGGRRLLVDDVSVRPFVSPEPVVTFVRTLLGDGEACMFGDQCVSRFCAVTCQSPDAGTPDAGFVDAGTPDAGAEDAGLVDAGTPDTGVADAGSPDAGVELPPGDYLVGCGCDGGGAASAWIALLLLLHTIRSRAAR